MLRAEPNTRLHSTVLGSWPEPRSRVWGTTDWTTQGLTPQEFFLMASPPPFSNYMNQLDRRISCFFKCAAVSWLGTASIVVSHMPEITWVHFGATFSYQTTLSFPRLWMQFLHLERDFKNSDKIPQFLFLLLQNSWYGEAYLAGFPDQSLCSSELNNNSEL